MQIPGRQTRASRATLASMAVRILSSQKTDGDALIKQALDGRSPTRVDLANVRFCLIRASAKHQLERAYGLGGIESGGKIAWRVCSKDASDQLLVMLRLKGSGALVGGLPSICRAHGAQVSALKDYSELAARAPISSLQVYTEPELRTKLAVSLD